MATAGKVYRVNAAAREGFIDRRRAGEAWPRGAGNHREVLVVDEAEDPPGRQVDGQFAIGQKTFELLKSDPEIFIDSADRTAAGDDAEKLALKAKIVELEAMLATATDPNRTAAGDDKAKGSRGK
jgi:hypothetical protein